MKSLHLTLLLYGLFIVPAVFAQNKPQTPVPPFNYRLDSVEYDNEAGTVHLGATLTYPASKGPFITIILISGSGQQDRDGSVFGHKPFAVLADYFTRNGYAVLRVDDRGRGKSKGDIFKATSNDFADDVVASIRFLLTRKEVKHNKIGLVGHSEGGFIAPMVYNKFPGLAFIISLAGTGVPGSEILLRQQTDPVKEFGKPGVFTAFYELTQKKMNLIRDNHHLPDSVILDSVKKMYALWKEGKPDSILVPLRADKATPENYATQVRMELQPWLKYFIVTDPAPYWEKVKCPVLALNGDKDIQVHAQQNLEGIAAALKKGKNKKVTVQTLQGLNHLFQTCSKCTVAEYGTLTETFSPVALDIMIKWLKRNIR